MSWIFHHLADHDDSMWEKCGKMLLVDAFKPSSSPWKRLSSTTMRTEKSKWERKMRKREEITHLEGAEIEPSRACSKCKVANEISFSLLGVEVSRWGELIACNKVRFMKINISISRRLISLSGTSNYQFCSAAEGQSSFFSLKLDFDFFCRCLFAIPRSSPIFLPSNFLFKFYRAEIRLRNGKLAAYHSDSISLRVNIEAVGARIN